MQLGDKLGSCQQDPNQRAIVIQITDECPQCEPNHLDIQALTWAKVRVCFTCSCLGPDVRAKFCLSSYKVYI